MDLLPDNAVPQEQLRIRRARVASAIDAECLDRAFRVPAERRVRVEVRLVAALSTLPPKRQHRADHNESSCNPWLPVLRDVVGCKGRSDKCRRCRCNGGWWRGYSCRTRAVLAAKLSSRKPSH